MSASKLCNGRGKGEGKARFSLDLCDTGLKISVFCHHANGSCQVRGTSNFSSMPSGCSRDFSKLGMSVGKLGTFCMFGCHHFSCPTTFDRDAGREHDTKSVVTNFSVSARRLGFSSTGLPRAVRRDLGRSVEIRRVGCAGVDLALNCTCG